MPNLYSYRGVTFENVNRFQRDGFVHEILEKNVPGVDGILAISMGFRGENLTLEGWLDHSSDPDTFFSDVRDVIDGLTGTLDPGHSDNIENVLCTGIRSMGAVGVDTGLYETYVINFRRLS